MITQRVYLKNLRERNNMTHADVAHRLNMSRSNFTNIENGERQQDMNFSLMESLAKIFKISFEEIAELERRYKNQQR